MNIAFGMILKELYSQRRRVFLTILAIAWGTASIAGMLAVGEGLRETFGRGMQSGGKAIISIYPGITSKDFHGLGKGIQVLLDQSDVNNIQKTVKQYGYNLNAVIGVYSFTAIIKYKDQTSYSINQAVSPEYFMAKGIKVESGGRTLNPLDNKRQRMVAVIGNKVAKNIFKKGENPIGKRILLGSRSFLIVGVTESKFQFGGRASQSVSDMILIPSKTYEGLAADQNFSSIIVSPKNPDDAKEVENIVKRVIAIKGGYDPTDEEFLKIYNSATAQQTMQNVFLGMQIFLGIVGGITLFVAGIGIANVMFISVKQNIKDIGIQMAIGARSYNILVHYIFEGLLTTVIGGVLGLLLVEIIIYLIKLIPVKGSFFAQIGKPDPVLSLSVVVAVIIVLGVIGLLSAFFPALRASQIDPARALREN